MLGRRVGGMDIVIRRICRESTFGGIVRWAHWLIDRALENLPWFQVQCHGVGIGLTLNWTWKHEQMNATIRTWMLRDGRRGEPAETCCCIPFMRNRGEAIGFVSLRMAATA